MAYIYVGWTPAVLFHAVDVLPIAPRPITAIVCLSLTLAVCWYRGGGAAASVGHDVHRRLPSPVDASRDVVGRQYRVDSAVERSHPGESTDILFVPVFCLSLIYIPLA